MSWIAATLSFLGIYLNARKNIWCWGAWMVSNILWLIYLVPKGEWALVCLWVMYFGMNVYGFLQWRKK